MKNQTVDPVIAAGILLLAFISSQAWLSNMTIQEKIGITLLSIATSLGILTTIILNSMKETRRNPKSA